MKFKFASYLGMTCSPTATLTTEFLYEIKYRFWLINKYDANKSNLTTIK